MSLIDWLIMYLMMISEICEEEIFKKNLLSNYRSHTILFQRKTTTTTTKRKLNVMTNYCESLDFQIWIFFFILKNVEKKNFFFLHLIHSKLIHIIIIQSSIDCYQIIRKQKKKNLKISNFTPHLFNLRYFFSFYLNIFAE